MGTKYACPYDDSATPSHAYKRTKPIHPRVACVVVSPSMVRRTRDSVLIVFFFQLLKSPIHSLSHFPSATMLAKPFVAAAAAAAVGCANARAFTRGDNSFEACVAKAVGGKTDLYSLPSGANYTTSLNIYNLDHIYIPSAVAWPTCAEEVAALVKCASAAGVAVQAQSGGHSYLVGHTSQQQRKCVLTRARTLVLEARMRRSQFA